MADLQTNARTDKQCLVKAANHNTFAISPVRNVARPRDVVLHGLDERAKASGPGCHEKTADKRAYFGDGTAEDAPAAKHDGRDYCSKRGSLELGWKVSVRKLRHLQAGQGVRSYEIEHPWETVAVLGQVGNEVEHDSGDGEGR